MNNVKKTILIVEDEPSYRNVLKDRLTLEGFSILTATDGEAGLALALKSHPDLIILDLQMAKMGGIAMTKRLREDEWGKKAKIIVLTNFSDPVKTEQALEQAIYMYLVKTDIKLEDLVFQITEFIK